MVEGMMQQLELVTQTVLLLEERLKLAEDKLCEVVGSGGERSKDGQPTQRKS